MRGCKLARDIAAAGLVCHRRANSDERKEANNLQWARSLDVIVGGTRAGAGERARNRARACIPRRTLDKARRQEQRECILVDCVQPRKLQRGGGKVRVTRARGRRRAALHKEVPRRGRSRRVFTGQGRTPRAVARVARHGGRR